MPIPLPPFSTTQSITGTVTLYQTTDDETVLVAAKQTLDSGPTVTVQSQTACIVEGDPTGDYVYNLTLPTAPPLFGPYRHPCRSCLPRNLYRLRRCTGPGLRDWLHDSVAQCGYFRGGCNQELYFGTLRQWRRERTGLPSRECTHGTVCWPRSSGFEEPAANSHAG